MTIKDLIRKHSVGIGMVFLTWLAFFSPIISGQYVYFLDDLKIIYYPIEVLYAQFQHAWRLPLWSNALGFGQPLLAWGQLGFFTPLHFLLRAFYVPALALLQISVMVYFLIGSIGMFYFLLRRKLHPSAATLGAIVFAYCGFNIGHLNHVNFYTSTMLLPWLLVAIDYLIEKASIKRAATLSLIATAIAVSGQPQVISYTFAIATIVGLALYIQKITHEREGAGKTLVLTVYAGVVALMLSSFAILPLQEFLPETERAAGLPTEELFEFSYPPYATITLVLPYFFGDHANYSGPKGFQELAAYTGIIPLILAGAALTNWKKYKAERIAGIALVTVGIALVLGRHSVIYQYLVAHHFITAIGVVGRFVFFFDIGIVILSAIGLQDILFTNGKAWRTKTLPIVAGYVTSALLIAVPFWIYTFTNPDASIQLANLLNWRHISVWLIAGGILLVPIASYARLKWALPAITALTLVVYGWDYNPRTRTGEATTPSPFIENLKQFKKETGTPARLYAAEHLPVTGNPQSQVTLSEAISPSFSVFQPLKTEKQPLGCLIIPIQADSQTNTKMQVMVRSGFNGNIWHTQTISSDDAFKNTQQEICFPPIPPNDQYGLMLSFMSDEQTNMKVFTTPSKNDISQLYFVRVTQPTLKQLERSRKPLNVQYVPDFPRTEDLESALLMRNVQAIAGASSARWIGALSIRPYREFIDSFFANDSEAFDGDGVHALTRNKKLVDLTGITHFAQSIEHDQTNDPMINASYELVREVDTGDSMARLYKNPSAFPKAFMVPNAEFVAANDEIRTRLRSPEFDPNKTVYISGPTPPNLIDDNHALPMQATAQIVQYLDTRVDIKVTTNKTAYLVLTDSTLPEWQTYIDDEPALPLKANSMFKAAQVPAGNHMVSFRYLSPAVQRAKMLTSIGLILIIIGYAYQPIRNSLSRTAP